MAKLLLKEVEKGVYTLTETTLRPIVKVEIGKNHKKKI